MREGQGGFSPPSLAPEGRLKPALLPNYVFFFRPPFGSMFR